MPLEILAPMVVLGIAGLALMFHFGGASEIAPLDPARARSEWQTHYPDIPAGEIRLDDAAACALVETPRGPGLLWLMGADTCARLVQIPPRIESRGDKLVIRTGDFTAPRVVVRLADPQAREQWRTALATPANAHLEEQIA